jgi:hypothetical protein
MRWIILLSVLAASATAMPGTADAQTWCIRDSAGITSEICAFSSADDCIRAALVGPSGGIICAPERGRAATTAGGRSNKAALSGARHRRHVWPAKG